MAGEPTETRVSMRNLEFKRKKVNCSVCGKEVFTIEYDHPSLFDSSKTYKHDDCVKKKR
jgi:hypothetical protein